LSSAYCFWFWSEAMAETREGESVTFIKSPQRETPS
jgi:hypothetical protein